MAVLHAEAAGDDAERLEAEALVQVPRVCVAGDDGVELHSILDVFVAIPVSAVLYFIVYHRAFRKKRKHA